MKQFLSSLYLVVIIMIFMFVFCESCRFQNIVERAQHIYVDARVVFIQFDNIIAPQFTNVGNRCIEESLSVEESDNCMYLWLRLDVIMISTWELFEELERTYDNNDYNNCKQLLFQLVIHIRSIVQIINNIDMDIFDNILIELINVMNQVCDIVKC